MTPDDFDFRREIYDNVHGFIKVTELENKVIDSPFFQRLRDIKQLGLLDYVFPGALHNRFNHSIGVMHIADKMVVSLQEKNEVFSNKRQLVRMAALLHDIGHYPLSHLIESEVKMDTKSKFKPRDISIEIDNGMEEEFGTEQSLENKIHNLNYELHPSRNDSLDFAHHERITGIVIQCTGIYDILKEKFDDEDIRAICQIIAGTYSGPESLIIHSELDADRFDYLLRDSYHTGVKYGLFDSEQIIRNLDYDEEDNLLVVNEKGQKAVEHYLLSKYFFYSTVIFHKATVGFELMVKKTYKGLLERGHAIAYLDLTDMFKDENSVQNYLDFTDSWFFNTLRDIEKQKLKYDKSKDYEIPEEVFITFVHKILNREPLTLALEEQKMVKSGENFVPRFGDDIIKNHIIEKTGIEERWYIPFEITISITNIEPHKNLRDRWYSSEDKEETIKIKKKHENGYKYLIEDEASIINVLSEKKLKIYRVYTKNKKYALRISEMLNKNTCK
ncbi:MAG: HD domain-containing protein [Methanolobus sp.]|jgi:HD superfamily phosphohydrolase|nr:HD domain-containing protein [Methanolobus sp.]